MLDVNGTPYHLLLGRRDWLPALEGVEALMWDAEHSSVSLQGTLPGLRPRAGAALSEEMRRGADRDGFGTIYWIDDERSGVMFQPHSGGGSASYWQVGRLLGEDEVNEAAADECDFRPCPDPLEAAELPTLWGLAVTCEHFLVVGTRGPSGLLIFDLAGGGPPVWWRWPETLGFSPFDMKATTSGELWVLDRPPGEPARLWHLDHNLRLVGNFSSGAASSPEPLPDFTDHEPPSPPQPECVEVPAYPDETLLLDGLSPELGLENPISIEVLADESILILDNPPGLPFSLIHRYVDGVNVGTQSLDGVLPLADDDPGSGDLLAQDFVLLRGDESSPGGLYLASQLQGQAFLAALSLTAGVLELEICPRYLPMRRFTGKALVAAECDVYYDFGGRWLLLAEHPRRRYEREGCLVTRVFDGKQPRVIWHRLLLDACVPNGSSVRIESRAAETRAQLATERWQSEPLPLLRSTGSELPFDRPFEGCDEEREGVGTWDVLFQSARGRYLELRLKLTSDGRSSPRLRAARIYYPRFSYLREYLPALYGEEPESASFMDRFLANPEGLLTELEGQIASSEAVLDARTAPAEYLEWLADWLGAVFDETWDEARRRLFLEHAHELYLWRGTPSGLLAWIRLALSECPTAEIFEKLGESASSSAVGIGQRPFDYRIVERFLTRGLPAIELGDTTEPIGPSFVVPDGDWTPDQGALALEVRFRDFVRDLYPVLGSRISTEDEFPEGSLNYAWGTAYESLAQVLFPPLLPSQTVHAADWRAFLNEQPSLLYADVTSSDLATYREFLARRYRQVGALNRAHQLGGSLEWNSFDSVELPQRLPSVQRALLDWIDFVSLKLPIQQEAHAFSVLVPTEPGEALDHLQIRLERARQVVEHERPAHTEFDVRPFWALFQVGSARLGFESQVGDGSRFVGLVLGGGALGETYLSEGFPWTETNRWIVGRDAPAQKIPGRDCSMEN